DLHKKKADVLRHFKKDPANIAIAWEQYSSEQRSRYENAAVRMHNGLEIKLDEQQRLIQHSRAVTESLPEEINPVATAIQHEALLSAAPVSFSRSLPSASEPIEIVEHSSVSSVSSFWEDEQIGRIEPKKVFNHLGTLESSHPGFPSCQSLNSNSVPTDSTSMTENNSAYREWKLKPIEGEPVTSEQFRDKLAQLSKQLSMPVQPQKPKVSKTSEIEELNLWLADPWLRQEVMPRLMKGERYTLEFDEEGEPLRVVEVKP
ncbi:MAG: hypothetical protein ACRDEA_04365, partial [Microcystaceae cyanobacterium]